VQHTPGHQVRTDSAITLEGWAVVFDSSTARAPTSRASISPPTPILARALASQDGALRPRSERRRQERVLGSGTSSRRPPRTAPAGSGTPPSSRRPGRTSNRSPSLPRPACSELPPAPSALVDRETRAKRPGSSPAHREVSWLVTPCEPRTIGFETLKGLMLRARPQRPRSPRRRQSPPRSSRPHTSRFATRCIA